MTILQAGHNLTEKLKTIYENGEAETMSEWVIEALTGVKRTDRAFLKEKTLDADGELILQKWTQRLLQHEPIQYVLNESWFCGLKFYVDENVLIPRPETEELVEWIITDCKFPVDRLSILDIGTGSGCIPIALKRRLPKANVWSCDISEGALSIAKKNASALGVNVNFLLLDFLQKEERNKLAKFDIVVSNPPYIPLKDKSTMNPNVVNYEPSTALFVPDNDALVFYKAIAGFGKKHLNEDGKIYTEINEGLGGATAEVFEKAGYKTTIKKDMQEKERMVKASV